MPKKKKLPPERSLAWKVTGETSWKARSRDGDIYRIYLIRRGSLKNKFYQILVNGEKKAGSLGESVSLLMDNWRMFSPDVRTDEQKRKDAKWAKVKIKREARAAKVKAADKPAGPSCICRYWRLTRKDMSKEERRRLCPKHENKPAYVRPKKIKRPKLPASGKTERRIAALGTPQGTKPERLLPFKLKGSSWKLVKKWVESNRDSYREEKKAYLTVGAMIQLTDNYSKRFAPLFLEEVRAKIKVLYAEELELDRLRVMKEIRDMQTKADSPSKASGERRSGGKGKDKWGYRLGTRAAKVNEAVEEKSKSRQWIERKIGAVGISSHLSALIKQNRIVRTKKGKYRLWDESKDKPFNPDKKKKRR